MKLGHDYTKPEQFYVYCPQNLEEFARGYAAALESGDEGEAVYEVVVRADCPQKVYVTTGSLDKMLGRA